MLPLPMRLGRYVLTASFLLAAPAAAAAQFVEERDGDSIESAPGSVSPDESNLDVSEAARLVIQRTNRFRREQNRGEVAADPDLAAAARSFAEFMARTDRFGHMADGNRPSERAGEHGYEYCLVTENIAWQQRAGGFEAKELARALVRGWRESPGHRENLLDPDVTDVGVGIARSEGSGTYYAVQMFGRPAEAAIEFRVTNESGVEAFYTVADRTYPLPPRFTRRHQRCRPAELVFHGADEDAPGRPAAVQDGDTFLVREEAGELRLARD